MMFASGKDVSSWQHWKMKYFAYSKSKYNISWKGISAAKKWISEFMISGQIPMTRFCSIFSFENHLWLLVHIWRVLNQMFLHVL